MKRDTICCWPELPFYPIVVPPLCLLCLEHNDVTFLVACVFSVYFHFLLAAASLLSGLFSIHRGWAMVFLFLEIALSWKGNDSSGGRWLLRLQRCFVPKRWSLDQIHEYRRKFVLRASCYASRMLSVSMSLAGCARGETRYVTSLANYEQLRILESDTPFVSLYFVRFERHDHRQSEASLRFSIATIISFPLPFFSTRRFYSPFDHIVISLQSCLSTCCVCVCVCVCVWNFRQRGTKAMVIFHTRLSA